MPTTYEEWNSKWGAPHGHREFVRRQLARIARGPIKARLTGPFGYQTNTGTRRFEYPWAYFATSLRPGLHIVDIGGGASGLPFVLAMEGCHVLNVDPGEEGWEVNDAAIGTLNRTYGTSVELRETFLEELHLGTGSIDRVFSVSTLEHIPPAKLASLMTEIERILVPGGYCILTVDLFLDLRPFSQKVRNTYGTNVDIKWLVEQTTLDLVQGTTSELNGFPEFDARRILEDLPTFLYGEYYPTVAQALVLQKPA